MNIMTDIKEDTNIKDDIEIAKFLLRDTISLRNEIHFTDVRDLVHPLVYTPDLKKYPTMNLIPALDKPKNGELKELFLKLIE